jgi:hypothetical protein
MEGIRLSTFLRDLRVEENMILNPKIKEETLDIIYEQLADYILQISRLEFPQIGTISKNA